MSEEITYQEPMYRFNIKQSAKGDTYGEFTVRGNSTEEVAKRADEMAELLKKFSTVVGK